VEQLQSSARQALVLADSARSSGDERKAVEYEQAGQSFASQLVAAERAIEDLKALYDQAVLAATEARRAVEQNAMLLQHKLAERTRLLTQLEQAKLQEQVADSLQQMSDTAIPTATPSLAEVRDKIEARYARALGQAELARSTMSGRMLEVESAAMDMAGAARLAEIRASITSSLPRAAEAIEAPDSKT
jgi:phage shock protein A